MNGLRFNRPYVNQPHNIQLFITTTTTVRRGTETNNQRNSYNIKWEVRVKLSLESSLADTHRVELSRFKTPTSPDSPSAQGQATNVDNITTSRAYEHTYSYEVNSLHSLSLYPSPFLAPPMIGVIEEGSLESNGSERVIVQQFAADRSITVSQ